MSSNFRDFFEEFIEESGEHLREMNKSLLALEQSKGDLPQEEIDTLFRSAHTIKGLAGMMEFTPVETLCHAIEDLMGLVREGKFELNDNAFQVLFKGVDLLELILNELEEHQSVQSSVDDVVAELHALASEGSSEAAAVKSSLSVDFPFDEEGWSFGEVEREKLAEAIKQNEYIYEIKKSIEGGKKRSELEKLPFFQDISVIGTCINIKPSFQEIEKAGGTLVMSVLLATPLNKEQVDIHVSDEYSLLREGGEVSSGVESSPPSEVAEASPAEASSAPSGGGGGEDYSHVVFCEDLSMVDEEMLEGFNADVEELLETLDLSLIELEQNPNDSELINTVFRAAHTIKGTSGMFGFSRIVELTHKLENLFDEIRKGNITIDSQVMDTVFSAVDKLRACFEEIKTMEDRGTDITAEVNSVVRIMALKLGGESVPPPPSSGVKEETSALMGELKIEGFQLSDTHHRLISEAREGGKKIYVLNIGFDNDVMKGPFDPMNLFMTLEMVGDVLSSALDIDDVPDFDHFSEEKFYLKYLYLIASKESEADVRKTLEAMEHLKIHSLSEVVPEGGQHSSSDVQRESQKPEEVAASPLPVNVPVKETASTQTVQQKEEKKPSAKPPAKAVSKGSSTIRVDIERLDKLLNLVGEFVIDRTRFSQIGDDLKKDYPNSPQVKTLSETNMLFGRHMNEIQEVIMSVRMVPIGNAFNKFPRVVRDLSRSLEKEIELELSGEDTELDKTLVEEIGDPLVHLIRNSVDHGIEMPDVRVAKGKPRVGTIKMSAFQEGSNIVIQIVDDGGGINTAIVYRKAVERGLVAEGEKLTDKEIFQLIFEPGFSTAAVVSNVSGRGVGMDVVRRNIEKLKGIIEIDSALGVGTTITIKLPLTLAIIQTLIVACNKEYLAIPLSSVVETVRIHPSEIRVLQGKEMINLRDNVLPLMRLADFYNFEKADPVEEEEMDERSRRRADKRKREKRLFVVIVGLAEKRLGLVVDSLKAQQEIVIKSIGKILSHALGISGGSIMGNGNVVLIVDVAEVINNADRVTTRILDDADYQSQKIKKSVMLCNSSRRRLDDLKRSLAQYRVVTVRDNEDIISRLGEEKVDMLITDGFSKEEGALAKMRDQLRRKDLGNLSILFLTKEQDIKRLRVDAGEHDHFLPDSVDPARLLSQVEKIL